MFLEFSTIYICECTISLAGYFWTFSYYIVKISTKAWIHILRIEIFWFEMLIYTVHLLTDSKLTVKNDSLWNDAYEKVSTTFASYHHVVWITQTVHRKKAILQTKNVGDVYHVVKTMSMIFFSDDILEVLRYLYLTAHV